MENKYKLLGCPFCGSVPDVREDEDEFSAVWVVECVDHYCKIKPTACSGFKLNAITAWNNRYEKQTAKES